MTLLERDKLMRPEAAKARVRVLEEQLRKMTQDTD